MDETYIKIKDAWKYLYRAVDKQGQTVDFLLTAKRDKAAAKRFFDKAMRHNSEPEKVTLEKAVQTKRPLIRSMLEEKLRLRFVRSSISITSWSRIIVLSSV